MSVGTYISGIGHTALVVWMIAGWGMSSEPLPFEVTDVSVVSGEEFAALTQGVQPELPPNDPAEIEQPAVDDTPSAPAVDTPPDVAPPPPPVEAPPVETPPVAPDLTVPEAVVTDAPPDVPDTPTVVTPSAELGSSPRPVPRPAPRVAPEIVAPPPPDATVAPDVTTAATDQVEAPVEEPVEPADETTAPEEAADQIVTEAEEPAFAPEISRRPATRPASVATAAAAANAPTDEPAVDPVAAALAEAATADANPAPTPTPTPGLSGGQLSEGDKSGFLRQIGTCWNTGSLSTGAQNTVIVMVFDMTPDGRPVSGSVRLESFTGGTTADADAAFSTARRALLRCSGDAGYNLPREQFELWQRVELTVDPTQMRQR